MQRKKNTGTIPIHNQITGNVFIRNFDQGIMDLIGGVRDVNNKKEPCWVFEVGGKKIPIYYSNPDPIFRKKVVPYIIISREMNLAMERWMGVGQLEYKVPLGDPLVIPKGTVIVGPDYPYPVADSDLTGAGGYQVKHQATPYDFSYTIQVWDKSESSVQTILHGILKRIHPVGNVIVYDSLNLVRSYSYLQEGGLGQVVEMPDPATRIRGYEFTIVVQGELDQSDPYQTTAVTGFDLFLERWK